MTPDNWQKMARKLLMKPEGRAALKTLGIDVELVGDKSPEAEKPTVVILMPSYRSPEPETLDAVKRMIRYTNESGKAHAYTGDTFQAGVVHWTRNWHLTKHLQSGHPWTHALLVDDDMTPEPDHLLKLLAHGKDIVSGLCTRRVLPAIPAIRSFDPSTESYDQIWEWPDNQLFDTGGSAGAAFLLVSKGAFEQVATAYFECLWERDYYGVTDEWVEREKARRLDYFDKTANCYWFRFLPSKAKAIEMGEDTSFCHIARKYCGIQIYCDSSVQPGHIGKYPFGVKDFIPHQRACIEEAKQAGTYKAPEDSGPSFRVTYEEPVLV